MRRLKSIVFGGLCSIALLAPMCAAHAEAEDCVDPDHATLTPVHREPAYYPYDAHEAGIEGYVVVTFDVTEEGTVANLRIVESDPRGVFEPGVIRTVSQWQYEPPTDHYGNVVRVCGKRQRFNYSLDEDAQ